VETLSDISVVIPTFNRAHVLPRALNSVFAQTLLPLEILVVDDGSTDTTKALVHSRYEGKRFPSVRLLTCPEQGVSAARNQGIRESSGQWIALLDSDDAWAPKKLEQQRHALQRSPDHRICHTDEIWIRDGKRVNQMKKHAKRGGWIFKECLPLCCISPSSVMIHRSIFDEVGLFDEDLPVCEDYDLWLRVTCRYPVLLVDEKLTIKYGGHPDQLSHKLWGMDRFRLVAMEKALASGYLDEEMRKATETTLRSKLDIYLQGARRRGRMSEVRAYEKRFAQFLGNSLVQPGR
jgi:glycosyltransferase involved in cell wall biosynthesis